MPAELKLVETEEKPKRLSRAELSRQKREQQAALTEKQCSRCQETKSVDAFRKRKSDGLFNAICWKCKCMIEREWQRGKAKRDPRYGLFNGAKHRAKKAGIPFDIRIDDVKIPEFCPVLGVKLERACGKASSKDFSPSLDRLVPSRGYVVGNVVVISHLANRIKTNANSVQVRHVAEWMERQGL